MERKLEAIGNAQLVIDLAQVVLDHLLRGPKLISDLLVALALRDAGDDVETAISKSAKFADLIVSP
jgi:hypothetical protein